LRFFVVGAGLHPTCLDGLRSGYILDGAIRINDNGDIVGEYFDSTVNRPRGFLLRAGTYTAFDFPGAIETLPLGINNAGQIVGAYRTVTGSGLQQLHGFLLSNGSFQTIDYPGAGSTVPTVTMLWGINNSGAIVGNFEDNNQVYHGFEYSAGNFVEIDYPGCANTDVYDINDSGTVIGLSCSPFTYANGQFTNLALTPPAPYMFLSTITFNNSEQIVGSVALNGGGSFQPGGFFLSTGPYAYVPISNGNVVSVYDTTFNLLTASIPVGAAPFDAAVSPNGMFVYVDNSSSSTVSVINPSCNAVIATIPVGPAGSIPSGIAVSPDSSTIYVAAHGSNVVAVIDAATNTVKTTVPVGDYPFLLAITPNGQYVYVPNFQSNNVSVISTATNTVVATVPVGLAPQSVGITPDGRSAYVTSTSSNLVDVIDTASNTVVQTIPVNNGPLAAIVAPNGTYAYVSEYSGATTAVINTANNTVIASIPVGGTPYGSAITPDGAFVWQTNWSASSVSVISTATNSVVATIPVSGYDFNVAIGPAPPTSQSITQPLSPTAPNVFNFGAHNFIVQYPPGTNFSGVNMTVTAALTTTQSFSERLVGTQFARATCIVYSGTGGNCVDYEVTCSSTSGGTISCPSVSTPAITVKTSFDTLQQIINPGFLTTPIGTNNWTNIFEAFYLQRVDPTVKGRTQGFSEFVAVDLGATNQQGAGTLQLLDPLRPTDARIFPAGTVIPVRFTLNSLANAAVRITDAVAGISVVQVTDANGNASGDVVLESRRAFEHCDGIYAYALHTEGYAPGSYVLTIYGNAFPAQQVQFTLPVPATGAQLVTTIQSLTLDPSGKQYQVVFAIKNIGSFAANGVIVSHSRLDEAETTTPLPLSLGDIAAGESTTATMVYPRWAGRHGGSARFRIREVYAGGTSHATLRVQLP
jgi:YVTN family beta-propeller protein/probable HAF family extracellular repeat protein